MSTEELPPREDDMDSTSILRRAHYQGRRAETYGSNQLTQEVIDLLQAHGLHPDTTGRAGMAVGSAGRLLRALGIVPAGDHTNEPSDEW